MKIFALYLRIDLTIKPAWFDRVRGAHASRSILHITLIQPRYVDESQIGELKNRVDRVLSVLKYNAEDKKIFFDRTEIEKKEDGQYLFMWFIKRSKFIVDLLKKLVEELKIFNNYCNEVTKEYESNFRPHMTVADMITNETEIHELLLKDSACEGFSVDFVLPIVKDKSVEESENQNNFTVFNI